MATTNSSTTSWRRKAARTPPPTPFLARCASKGHAVNAIESRHPPYFRGKLMTRRLAMVLLLLWSFAASAAQTDLLDIGEGAVVLSFTSEYGPIWAALLLVDGSTGTGWCSAQGKPHPNEIVIELPQLSELTAIALDNTGNQEGGYAGISAKHVEIHASTKSAKEGYQKISAVEVPRSGRNEVSLPATRAKWLKFVILSNWGNADFTELMELEAYGKPLETAKTAEVSGVYRTNYTPMLLEQSGSNVYGCYGSGTSLAGSFNGRVLQMEWRQGDGSRRGSTVMVLSDDNKFLNGLWYENGSYG